MAKVRRMFPGGNTANGFYSLHDNIIGPNRNMLYILKGMPGGGKSSLMKEVGKRAIEEGFTVEFHHCPSDPNSIDGVVIIELGIGIVDGTPPHVVDPIYPGLIDRLIDLGQFINPNKLVESKEDIIRAKINNKAAYRKAFAYFKSAKVIYEEIIENNKNGVDFKGVNHKTRLLIEEIFSKEPKYNANIDFAQRHMFSNANTPDGYIDYTKTILEWFPNIYYIEGEIGTGKSTLMKRLIEESKIRGYSIEIYHNSTIPEKIETLIIKDINTCITSNKHGLDFSHNKVNLNEYFNEKIKDNKDYEVYNLLIQKAIANLSTARNNHEILEKCYKTAVDYQGINKIREKILEEIFA
jgi:hypothetical protein